MSDSSSIYHLVLTTKLYFRLHKHVYLLDYYFAEDLGKFLVKEMKPRKCLHVYE